MASPGVKRTRGGAVRSRKSGGDTASVTVENIAMVNVPQDGAGDQSTGRRGRSIGSPSDTNSPSKRRGRPSKRKSLSDEQAPVSSPTGDTLESASVVAGAEQPSADGGQAEPVLTNNGPVSTSDSEQSVAKRSKRGRPRKADSPAAKKDPVNIGSGADTEEPETVNGELQVNTPPPQINGVHPEPEVATPEKEGVTPQPAIAIPEPEVAIPEPEVVVPGPEVIVPEPEVVVPEPEVVVPEQEDVIPEQEVATPKSAGRTSKRKRKGRFTRKPQPTSNANVPLESQPTSNANGPLESQPTSNANGPLESQPTSNTNGPVKNGPRVEEVVSSAPKPNANPVVRVNPELEPMEFSDTEPDFDVPRPILSLGDLSVVPSGDQMTRRIDEVHGLLLLWGDYNSYKAETGGWLHRDMTRSMEVTTEGDGIIRANMEVILHLSPKKSANCRLDINDITSLNVDRMRSVLPKLRPHEWTKIIRSSSSCAYHRDESAAKGSNDDLTVKLHLKREVMINLGQKANNV